EVQPRVSRRLVLALGAAVLMVAAALSGREMALQVPAFAAWVRSLSVLGPLAFVAAYTVVSLLLMPAVLLTLAAGALWGFSGGLAAAMAGATAGSTASFLAGRYLVRGFVEAYVAKHPRLAVIDRAVEAEGARLVLLLRLSPAVPYVLLNYVLGVSRLPLRAHLIGLAGMVPPAAMYVYAGKFAGDLAALASGTAHPRGPAYYLM